MERKNERQTVFGSGSKQWFALYTTARAEKRVAGRISATGIECFLPLLQVQRKWSDRVKTIEVPLFNSYLFVKVRASELYDLNKTDGVVKTVYCNGVPAVVREAEIEVIRKYIARAGYCEPVSGDQVEIVCGALAGGNPVAGKIIRVKKHYLYLYIEQLGVRVCVKKCEVRKIEKA